jgi:hypothetical protein
MQSVNVFECYSVSVEHWRIMTQDVSLSARLKEVARATRKKNTVATCSFYSKLDVRLVTNCLTTIINNFVILQELLPTRTLR